MVAVSETGRGELRRGDVPIDAFDYDLPAESIAQHPVEPRSAARLLVAPDLAGADLPARPTVADLPSLLRPGDVLVVNDTRVLAARLPLRKTSGGAAEVLLVEPVADDGDTWEALVRPGRRLPPGTLLVDGSSDRPVVEFGGTPPGASDGRRLVHLLDPTVVERCGTVPLPPYLHGSLPDPDRYQTVYAGRRGLGERSAAAPTAGLHFTPELLDRCRAAGATIAQVDLLIGLDTFRPITAATVEGHRIHSERYTVPGETMERCAGAERVVAIGTTTVRALESAAATGALSGRTELYIHGDFDFRVVDVLVTNFHLPRSSLLVLLDAFCGAGWRALYERALAEGYRFLSFGDAMVVGRRRPRTTPPVGGGGGR